MSVLSEEMYLKDVQCKVVCRVVGALREADKLEVLVELAVEVVWCQSTQVEL